MWFESWIKSGDLSPLSELIPLTLNFFYIPHLTGRGGGLVMFFKHNLRCRLLTILSFTSTEPQLIHLNSSSALLIILIYWPPASNKFIGEFADFLEAILTKHNCILILDDFNIHVCCSANAFAKDFLNLMSSLKFVQWVNGPTHTWSWSYVKSDIDLWFVHCWCCH